MTASHAYVGIKAKPLRAVTSSANPSPGEAPTPSQSGHAFGMPVGHSAHGDTPRSEAPFTLRRTEDMQPETPPHPITFHADHRVLTAREWHAVASHFALSPRETEVAHRIFDDLRESEIATKLGISPHTVHTHIERLYRKTGVASRSALVITLMAELRTKLSSGSHRQG